MSFSFPRIISADTVRNNLSQILQVLDLPESFYSFAADQYMDIGHLRLPVRMLEQVADDFAYACRRDRQIQAIAESYLGTATIDDSAPDELFNELEPEVLRVAKSINIADRVKKCFPSEYRLGTPKISIENFENYIWEVYLDFGNPGLEVMVQINTDMKGGDVIVYYEFAQNTDIVAFRLSELEQGSDMWTNGPVTDWILRLRGKSQVKWAILLYNLRNWLLQKKGRSLTSRETLTIAAALANVG